MRVLHVPFGFHPDPHGGTEVYVESLAHQLAPLGVESEIAAPGSAGAAARSIQRGLIVHRWVPGPEADLDELYGAGDPESADAFGRILDDEQPDLVHLHAYTRAISTRLAEVVKSHALPLVLTYHTPTVTCQRGTLLRFGHILCDGRLIVSRCAACVDQAMGVPRPVADMLGHVPISIGEGLRERGKRGGGWTALRMTELMDVRHRNVLELFALADAVVAVAGWVHDLLVRLGVPEGKLVLSRQGVADLPPEPLPHPRRADPAAPLRAIYLGRLDPTKGIDVVIRALRGAPEVRVHLDIFGVAQGASGQRYFDELRRLAAGDSRIRFMPAIPSEQVVRTVADYDVTLVPSRWLETGPLVVLESFAARVPVIGSRLGGIAELVRDGVDGLLVSHGDDGAWRGALRRLHADRALLPRLAAGVRPPRTMADAARDMATLYKRVLGRYRPERTPPHAHAGI